MMGIVISLGLCEMVPSSSAIALGNMVGQVNIGMDMCNQKLVTYRILTWALRWEPAVITIDWNP